MVGTAVDGKDAVEKTKRFRPDLVTMDVNMPIMDGLDALAAIMEECPVPVVMLSSLTQKGTDATIRALSLGAVDFISKTGGSISKIDTIIPEILEKCRNAAKAKVRKMSASPPAAAKPAEKGGPGTFRHIELPKRSGLKLGKEEVRPAEPEKPVYGAVRNNPLLKPRAKVQPKPAKPVTAGSCKKLVAIGTSTGGPQALQNVITRLPGDLPCGVVVVQHMPPGFTRALADRLDSISAISVKEAEHDDIIQPGHVYIAPGNYHMRVKQEGSIRKIQLSQEPPVGNHRPAVNVLFDSVASVKKELVSVIMTGMGCDGCEGMKKIKQQGGYSIAQDEETSVVYGMPKAVVDAGLADEVRPVQEIAAAIVAAVKR